MLQPVIRVSPVTSHDKSECILGAYECLRAVGIKPVGYSLSEDPLLLLVPETLKKALTRLLAAGFEIREVQS